MRTVPRTRHYVSPGTLTLCRPVLSFDYAREAYILRGIGDRVGPVLREERRRRRRTRTNRYEGPERRGAGVGRVHVSPMPTAPARASASPARSAGQPARAASSNQVRTKVPGTSRSKASRRPRSKNARG